MVVTGGRGWVSVSFRSLSSSSAGSTWLPSRLMAGRTCLALNSRADPPEWALRASRREADPPLASCCNRHLRNVSRTDCWSAGLVVPGTGGGLCAERLRTGDASCGLLWCVVSVWLPLLPLPLWPLRLPLDRSCGLLLLSCVLECVECVLECVLECVTECVPGAAGCRLARCLSRMFSRSTYM